MEKDIKAITVLLATQAMINMGEIPDPITHESREDIDGAATFIELVEVLTAKTKGNLTPEEDSFLVEVKANLDKVYQKKVNAGWDDEE